MRVTAVISLLGLFVAIAIAGATIPAFDTLVLGVTQTEAQGIAQRSTMAWALLVVVPVSAAAIFAAASLIFVRGRR